MPAGRYPCTVLDQRISSIPRVDDDAEEEWRRSPLIVVANIVPRSIERLL